MDHSTRVLRLDIEGLWSAHEFGRLLAAVADLYNVRLLLETMYEDGLDFERTWEEMIHFPPLRHRLRKFKGPFANPFMLMGASSWWPSIPTESEQLLRLTTLVYPDEQLSVRRIRYESPGFSDLAGIGAVVGHIKDFILRLIELRSQRRERDLANQRLEAQVTAQRIENARQLVSLADDLGLDRLEIRKLVGFVDDRQEVLISTIEHAQLTGARMLEAGESRDDT